MKERTFFDHQVPMLITVALVVLVIGISVGYAFSPSYRLDPRASAHTDLGQADRWLDQRYLRSMIAHHRGAILLAEQASKQSKRPEILALSSEIQQSEPALIAELVAWKEAWYGDYLPIPDPQVAQLGGSDANFDLRFLNALISHHEDGLVMTGEVRKKSSRAEVLDNADAVEAFLTKTLPVFKQWRTDWYFSSEKQANS